MKSLESFRLPAWLLVGVVAVTLLATRANAAVRLEGPWPDADSAVSLEAQGLTRSEAIRRLADAMGWSIVIHSPKTDVIDLVVHKQPAVNVLSMILADDDYVARREGSLIAIEKDIIKSSLTASSSSASPPSSAPTPDALPTASKPQDRVLTGGSTRIEKDEVVRDVVVFGGSADVFGTATGDVTVIGGSARIHRGAHVMGDATAVGGSLHVDDGSRVDGDVGVVGGVLRRGDTAQIGGRSASNSMGEKDEANEGNAWPWYRRVLTAAGRAIAEIAVLFLLGSVFLALASSQMRELQAEVAARPMRSLALGIVGTICFAALLLALTISVVGIPIAIVALLLVIIGAYAGVTSVLAVLGSALLGHRTRNPYTHLALGCLLFLLAKALPLLGTIVLFVVVLLGFGTIVATRGASLLAKRSRV